MIAMLSAFEMLIVLAIALGFLVAAIAVGLLSTGQSAERLGTAHATLAVRRSANRDNHFVSSIFTQDAVELGKKVIAPTAVVDRRLREFARGPRFKPCYIDFRCTCGGDV